MLLDEHDWTVFVPYFAQFPFEMMLVPHRFVPTLAEATEAELKGLALRLRFPYSDLTGCWAKLRVISSQFTKLQVHGSKHKRPVFNLRAYSALQAPCKSFSRN